MNALPLKISDFDRNGDAVSYVILIRIRSRNKLAADRSGAKLVVLVPVPPFQATARIPKLSGLEPRGFTCPLLSIRLKIDKSA